ncbi:dolichyl-phosphate-mannose--protein mannosyltransferase [Actinomadura verrucosospora]|uniref:Polyprenol-phosphate-mannose--protein mannosyltransferase n=1 Tax=Actinomadura verrucosospora TaxID=46165 RepID=A0A7D3VVG1_ACTVE|nr:phospholipid carrier-dependent glycosyltransferase [Actinomadura verrucosospora]QKG24173.1 glycosyl transferase family protein [Actinomadura verrucosospora]
MTASVAVNDPPALEQRRRLAALPWGWIGPLAVSALAGLLVFHRLGSPHALVWDETYYAKDAWSYLHYGVEHNWHAGRDGEPANAYFLAGHPVAGLAEGGEWAAHPPVGKWLIAAGIAVFGAGPFGYRAAAGVAGVLAVLILARTARRMTGSTVLGCAAGLLMALDGSWLVSSRMSMLDVFLLLWVTAGFGCLVVDRDRTRAALAARLTGAVYASRNGPFVRHGWRIGAGVCFGLACGTKWSGLYVMAVFWVLAMLWDRNARKAAGVERPWRGMLKLDLLPSLLGFWFLAGAVYVASWWGWFVSGTGLQKALFGQVVPGYQRNWAERHPSGIWPSFLDPVRSLWHYHAITLDFHDGVTQPNPAQSWPWQWPYLGHPAVMYRTTFQAGQDGCRATKCVAEISNLGTPVLWWFSIAALVSMALYAVLFRDWRATAAVGGYLASWLPWFPAALADRTMYSTYTLPMLPFAVLAIVLLFDGIVTPYRDRPVRRALIWTCGGAYVAAVAVNLLYLYPILTAQAVPESAWHARLWLPGWT